MRLAQAFVGRLAPEKGLDTLIDAWPIVQAAHPEARLILIGEGPERASLEARVAARGLTLGPGQAVEMPGVATDATNALRDADLFVLPSREEGMSIALLEAMALGVPPVASSIPGNRRLISDFKHGRLAPPDDPEGLARVINEQWATSTGLPHEPRREQPRRAGILHPVRRPQTPGIVPGDRRPTGIGFRSFTQRAERTAETK